MSEVKVNKISPRSGTDVTLGDSGDTFTIPAGATINNQGTATNFGATGSASWTTTVKTSTFTAVAGEGYFVNTTGGAVTVNLPAGTAGAVVAIKDYAGTFDTNAVTLVQNGSDKIGGSTDNKVLNTEGIAATLIFIDSTQGWLVTDDGLQSTVGGLPYSVDFLVIAGGGGGGIGQNSGSGEAGGGGGGGGYRTSTQTVSSGTVITITVGDGAAAVTSTATNGNSGSNSSISGSSLTTITSAGGGGGGGYRENGVAGGSGGGAGSGGGLSPNTRSGGVGDTPSTSPSQGNTGGNSDSATCGGGGGAGAVGGNGGPSGAGAGGAGAASSITGSSVTRAGGGGGGLYSGTIGPGGSGGGGDGGEHTPASSGTDGTVNLGGGGGGGSGNSSSAGAGGKGVVILSVLDADYTGTTTGSPTVATGVSGKTVLTFTGTGSYTA